MALLIYKTRNGLADPLCDSQLEVVNAVGFPVPTAGLDCSPCVTPTSGSFCCCNCFQVSWPGATYSGSLAGCTLAASIAGPQSWSLLKIYQDGTPAGPCAKRDSADSPCQWQTSFVDTHGNTITVSLYYPSPPITVWDHTLFTEPVNPSLCYLQIQVFNSLTCQAVFAFASPDFTCAGATFIYDAQTGSHLIGHPSAGHGDFGLQCGCLSMTSTVEFASVATVTAISCSSSSSSSSSSG